MKQQTRSLVPLAFLCIALVVGVGGTWTLLRSKRLKAQASSTSNYALNLSGVASADPDMWYRALEKVKEDRIETSSGPVETPPQLRHYSDRHWFLATQVAEVKKFGLHSCQDLVDLAAMIDHGELVVLPAVTDSYILFGVGARVDGSPFDRFVNDHDVPLYDEAALNGAYARLATERSNLQNEISRLNNQLANKNVVRSKQKELQKQIASRQQDLQRNDDEKTSLDSSYGQAEVRQKLVSDYASLQLLAKNFAGRSFNLDSATDRYTLKVCMLSSLRPAAIKILEEVAKGYHGKFDRPLPVSSLVRPEQYQHSLRRVNRNAVLIDTPPHTTGLAFDIDYRYMTAAEQNFVMADLARLKDEGRIEVIRERNANFHIFAFIDGRRPSDELITASLDEATVGPKESDHATEESKKVEKKKKSKEKKSNAASRSRSKKRRK